MRQDIGKEHDLDKRERFLRINKGNLSVNLKMYERH